MAGVPASVKWVGGALLAAIVLLGAYALAFHDGHSVAPTQAVAPRASTTTSRPPTTTTLAPTTTTVAATTTTLPPTRARWPRGRRRPAPPAPPAPAPAPAGPHTSEHFTANGNLRVDLCARRRRVQRCRRVLERSRGGAPCGRQRARVDRIVRWCDPVVPVGRPELRRRSQGPRLLPHGRTQPLLLQHGEPEGGGGLDSCERSRDLHLHHRIGFVELQPPDLSGRLQPGQQRRRPVRARPVSVPLGEPCLRSLPRTPGWASR